MANNSSSTRSVPAATVYPILFAISIVHLLNDSTQSAIAALYPILKGSLDLSFAQIGMISFAMNITASILQPLIGIYADHKPRPFILPIGVVFTLVGVITLAIAPKFGIVLVAVTAVGIGSAIFHPESSRVAYLAAGARRGLAQSIFQVGGNLGSSLGPIMTALVFVHVGQFGLVWFSFAMIAALIIQLNVARWYRGQNILRRTASRSAANERTHTLTKWQIGSALAILIALVASKNVYISGITSYYSFYLIQDYGVSLRHAQLFLFAFLAASAVGTFLGGPLADRYGRRNIIWLSVLGTAPFSILLPHGNLFWSLLLCMCAGFVLSSAFSIIVVYAQELLPNKVGLVSGMFFGVAFGLGGLGSAVLGSIADVTSIAFIMNLCGFLPLIGILTGLLPKDEVIRG